MTAVSITLVIIEIGEVMKEYFEEVREIKNK